MSKNASARMSQTVADATTETVDHAAFDASRGADQFRAFAEKGVEQSKEAYSRMKTGAETAQKALETSVETVKSASSEMTLKTVAALRTNTEAAFAHIEALMGVKSLSEVLELQTSFLRKQFEAAVEQGKDLQVVATKAAEDVARPMRDMLATSMKELKVA